MPPPIGLAMSSIGSSLLCGVQGFEIDDYRLLRVAHDHPLRGRIRGVNLLVRHKRRYINKIPRLYILLEFQLITPADLAPTRDHVNDRLKLAMMMFAARDMGINHR